MEKHKIAQHYAERAVKLLEQEYSNREANITLEFATFVATAYHNAAVEYEFNNDLSNCLLMFQRANKIAQTHLGQDHELTKSFTASERSIKSKLRRK